LAEPNIAVLIDFENVGIDNIQSLFDELSDVGRVIVKRAYANWATQTSNSRKQSQLMEMSIQPVHQFHSNKSGKNSSDIRMVVDAMDLMHSLSVDVFVIVSADSDFLPLVVKLREEGKTVIGSGMRKAVSHNLVQACDRYIYLDTKQGPISTQPSNNTKNSDPRSVLVRAFEASSKDGRIEGSRLFLSMQRLDPGFHYKNQGFASFGQFLQSYTDLVNTTRRTEGDLIVELNTLAGNSDNIVRPKKKLNESIPTYSKNPGKSALNPNSNENLQNFKKDNSVSNVWDVKIHDTWIARGTEDIASKSAATDAAKVLGTGTLSNSQYKTLKKLISSSTLLQRYWKPDSQKVTRLRSPR
tara:strand:- start:3132 stop:4196 length:1065 start_codon:yes stop_codon:yes gene_type:complete